ncbi:hypothetical protein ACR9E3_31505 [Actinomycetospora sp. C-140]
MYHVALSYPGRRPVGVFLRPEDFHYLRTLRSAGRPGSVTALDARAREIVVHVERLAADPELLGYGADPLGGEPARETRQTPVRA